MKVKIIPTILVKSFNEVRDRIKKVEDCVEWVQLDVMDGVFVNNETWPYSAKGTKSRAGLKKELEKLKKLKAGVGLEVHLMVQKPEEIIEDWLEAVDRVIVHFESKITNRELGIRDIIGKVHSWRHKGDRKKLLHMRSTLGGKQIGVALNPETHQAVVTPFLKDLDLVLIMTVQPGWGGQEFKDWTLDKIKDLRKRWPKGNIGVDGGISPKIAKKAIMAGANLVCAGTYIFNSKNIEEAVKNLKRT